MERDDDTIPVHLRMSELGAVLIVTAGLLIATVVLSVQGVKSADDLPINGGDDTETSEDSGTLGKADLRITRKDLYDQAPACSALTAELAANPPLMQSPLGEPTVQPEVDTQLCDFNPGGGSWVHIRTRAHQASEGMSGYQIAREALTLIGGWALIDGTAGDYAVYRPCTEEVTCTTSLQHANAVVEITVTFARKHSDEQVREALVEFARGYTGFVS